MFYGEHLFSTASGGLEDANVPGFNNIEAGTGIAFVEDKLASGVVLGNSTIRQELEFRLREVGKDGYTSQNGGSSGPGFRHLGILCHTWKPQGATWGDTTEERPTVTVDQEPRAALAFRCGQDS